MSVQFRFSLFISVLACLLLAFFAGFFLTKSHEGRLKQNLLKQSLKVDSFSYLDQIRKKWTLLLQEGNRIQHDKSIRDKSLFFAFVAHESDKEPEVYTAGDQTSFLNVQEQNPKTPEKRKGSEKELNVNSQQGEKLDQQAADQGEEYRLKLVKLSRIDFSQNAPGEGYQFKVIEAPGEEQPFVLFVKMFSKEKYWVGFLKKDREFFQLSSPAAKGTRGVNREVFSTDYQGRVFFHNEESGLFKKLSKKSPLWKSLKEFSERPSLQSRFLKTRKKSGLREMYCLRKGKEGNMIVITQADFQPSFFALPFFSLSKNSYSVFLGLSFLAFFLFFIFFFFKISALFNSYKFLKMAFLFFDKSGVFPPPKHLKNPLLYFYNNRQPFLSKKEDTGGKGEEKHSGSLSFQDIVGQELEKLKLKYPQFTVKKEFDYFVKVFGFEKFVRTIVRELLLNALEAMGGVREPRLDLSLKRDGKKLIFSVRDYGAGVPNQNPKKLFRVYYSGKSQLGVGLTLIQSIVQANGGSIELSSPEGGGLKVDVFLPLKCFLKNHFGQGK